MITIRSIREPEIGGFHLAVDTVCRERKYLATFEAHGLERTRSFVISNITEGHPQFVAEDDGRIIG